MQVFSAEQIRQWDAYTIQHEPISSLDLMERAVNACVDWLDSNGFSSGNFHIFCGKGNNGGDGLAIARILSLRGNAPHVYILEFGFLGTADFQQNLERLHQVDAEIRFIQQPEQLPIIPAGAIIIDALFGTGLSRPAEGLTANLIQHINNSGNTVVAIDVPSGMYTDKSSVGNVVVKATFTLTFQCYKLCLLMPENADANGYVHTLDIRLNKEFAAQVTSPLKTADFDEIFSLYKPRLPYAHKGNFGHALLLAGSHGKMGAAILASRACLKSGVGLLTAHVPKCGYTIMQTAVPELMVSTDEHEEFSTNFPGDLSSYAAIGIGPGLGKANETKTFLKSVLNTITRPLVLDADALNIIGEEGWLNIIPRQTIITPHPKEFERLFGKTKNDFHKVEVALHQAREMQLVIVLKGHRTLVALPNGTGCFNTTGNAGMARGGSGDMLTGMLTGLLAQGYSASDAALFGVYWHGRTGDAAAKKYTMQSMLPTDMIELMGEGLRAG